MNKLKKMIAAIVACVSVAALAIGIAACDGGTKGPTTLEKTKISDCKLEYNWGEVFSGENLAYEVTYSDGTKDYITEGFTFTRKGDADISKPLTGSDTEISVVWNGKKDEKEYTFSDKLTLTMVDPHTADAVIFVTSADVSGNDKVHMFGDGTFYACGVQADAYWQVYAAKGYWSWDGSELCVVVNEQAGQPYSDGGRTISVAKEEDGSYYFTIYWTGFPMNIRITKAQADVYLTAESRFGNTENTKDKNYPVWDDQRDIGERAEET